MSSQLHDVDKYPMMKSLNADPRLIGLEASLSPFVNFTSSQRLNMFSSNIVQSLIVRDPEMPNISSGYEREFLNYTFNPTRMERNGTTIHVLPKYRTNIGSQPIKLTPAYVVIYIGEDDDLIHCMTVPTYMRGIDGFGYMMEINHRMLSPNLGLQKGDCIAHSHAVQGSKYCLGRNANVCYITMKETVEDAFCISESFAKHMESTGIKTLTIDIGRNDVPLNLYGDADDYKFLPDIGEYVREDGIICALRQVNDATIISDMNELSLTIPQYAHDSVFYAAAPGAQIIDIDVAVNRSKKVKTPDYIFSQMDKYIAGNMHFYQRIMDIYQQECISNKRAPAPEFNTLVTRAASMMTAFNKSGNVFDLVRRSPPKFTRKSELIEFMQVVVTYRYDNVISLGHKFTGRDGAKGVVSAIIPDKDMPVNDFGVCADICKAPEANLNRMNLGQIYEQFLNCLIYEVVEKVKITSNIDIAYSYILEFIRDVNPDYADVIESVVKTSNQRAEFVGEIIKTERIIIVVPSFLNTLTPEWCLYMSDKYKVRVSPVSYNLYDDEHNFLRRVRTKKNIYIGKKYLFVLCKIPYARACGVAYVNQYKIPIRIKERKVKEGYPVGLTPIRLGEDEVRNLSMVIGEDMTYRIISLYANSPEGTDELVETLLTADKPTQIEWILSDNAALTAGNQTIKVYNHLMNTCGVDSVYTNISPYESEELSSIE